MTFPRSSIAGLLYIALLIQIVTLRKAHADPASTFANHRQGRPHVPRPVICSICTNERLYRLSVRRNSPEPTAHWIKLSPVSLLVARPCRIGRLGNATLLSQTKCHEEH